MLAGFPDGRADEGAGAGPASLAGLRIARERGWTAPAGSSATAPPTAAPDDARDTRPQTATARRRTSAANGTDDRPSARTATDDD